MTALSYIQSYATFCDQHIVKNIHGTSLIDEFKSELVVTGQPGYQTRKNEVRNRQAAHTTAFLAMSILFGSCRWAPQFSSAYASASLLAMPVFLAYENQDRDAKEPIWIAGIATVVFVAQRIYPRLALISSGLAAGAAAFVYGAVEHAIELASHEYIETEM